MLYLRKVILSSLFTHLLPYSSVVALPQESALITAIETSLPRIASLEPAQLSQRDDPKDTDEDVKPDEAIKSDSEGQSIEAWYNATYSSSAASQKYKRDELSDFRIPALDLIIQTQQNDEASTKNPDGAIEARADNSATSSLAEFRLGLEKLHKGDQKCADRLGDPRKLARSLDIEERQNRPSDLLFRAGAAVVVTMGGLYYHPWSHLPDAIGTYGMCGCTTIVVVGTYGTLLAHIDPSGDNLHNIDGQLASLLSVFNDHIRPFSQAYTLIFPPADAQGVSMLQEYEDYITSFLINNLGLHPIREAYHMDVTSTNPRLSNVVIQRVAGTIWGFLDDGRIF